MRKPEFNRVKHRLAAFHDLSMTAASFVLAVALRVGFEVVDEPYTSTLALGLPVIVVIAACMFWVFGLHRGIWAYASVRDLQQIVKAVTATMLCFLMVMFLVNRLDDVPRSAPVIQWFVLLVLLGGPRYAYRLWRDRRTRGHGLRRVEGRERILLVGANDRADLLIRSLAVHRDAPYQVVGVLDEKGRRVGRSIHGVQVLGRIGDMDTVLDRLAKRHLRPARMVLTVEPKWLGTDLRGLFAAAERHGMTLAAAPDITAFTDPLGPKRVDQSALQLKPIEVEDLLGRAQTELDQGAIADLVRGRAVLVTGAGGTIGAELTTQIADYGPSRLILVDNGEYNLYRIDQAVSRTAVASHTVALLADVRDRDRVMRLFDRYRPDVVFHAAALKHVPLSESNETEAVATNVLGTRHVADAARAHAARAMVLISTDKAVRPSSVMGATKRVAESYCQSIDRVAAAEDGPEATRFLTVRFGNVLGSSGSVVPLFREQLARGGPLTVTHPDMRRYFMTVREAVELVLQASAHGLASAGERGRILMLDMGEPVRIVDLARQMIRLAGLRPDEDVSIVFTGLRPGEKLHEELLDGTETAERTGADGVLSVAPRMIEWALLVRAIDQLALAAREEDGERLRALLANIVPDFGRIVAGQVEGRARHSAG